MAPSSSPSTSNKKTLSCASTTNTTSGTTSGFLKMSYFNIALLIIVPYLMGVYISNQNLTLVQRVLQPLLSSSTGVKNSMLSAVNNSQNPPSLHKTTTTTTTNDDDDARNQRSVLSSTTTTTTTPTTVTKNKEDSSSSVFAHKCFDRLVESMSLPNQAVEKGALLKAFENIDIVLHHDGQAQGCGRLTTNLMQGMLDVLLEQQDDDFASSTAVCPLWSDKYHVESFLTRVFHRLLLQQPEAEGQGQCASNDEEHNEIIPGFYGYCDRGEARTPILLDHGKLIHIPQQHDNNSEHSTTTLPCHFHSQLGVRITSLPLLLSEAVSSSSSSKSEQDSACINNNGDNDAESCVVATEDDDESSGKKKEFHLSAVPAGRVFMFAPSHVGQVIPLPHITGGDPNKPVELHVLSVHPSIFDITNFFTKAESNDVVQRALQETRNTHKIKRSSTGATGYNINTQRTSESGFDTEGETAMILKRRGMALLGFDEYMEGHTDGLQVLRYNLTTAYIPHMDWIDGSGDKENDYESAQKGGNRYATILLYMSDLDEHDGGETVFVEAWPGGLKEEDRIPMSTAIRQVRESGDADMLEKGSWEETMVAQCRTRLAIRPNSAKAILFYSQKPNGEEDKSSKHGACPILRGDKWAANLWVWNTPRPGFAGNPRKAEHKGADDATAAGGFRQVVATFINPGTNSEHDEAELFFQDDLWAKLGPHDPEVRVNTYKGHTWTARVQDRVIQSWTIDDDTDVKPTFVLE